jgi:uncharacterized protein (UPF0548 family)
MFLWRKPDARRIATTLATAAGARFNYESGAGTLDAPPPAYFRNHTAVIVGEGEAVWRQAVAALSRWQVTRLGWCEFFSSTATPEAGQVVAACVSHLGFWSLQPSRILAVENDLRRYAFSIRTLAGHDEAGEEQFAVDWLPSGEVRFAIRSYSRPANLAGWLALPYARHLQRRFGREAARVMQTLVQRQ